MPLKIVHKGEICSECGEATMLHPALYTYTCSYCRYSYIIQPVSNPFSRGITVLNKSEVRKLSKKQK